MQPPEMAAVFGLQKIQQVSVDEENLIKRKEMTDPIISRNPE